MKSADKQYQDLIGNIMSYGENVQSRNSMTKRVENQKLQFDSTPLITVRKTAWKSAIREWEWFMSGSTDINQLHPSVRPWWNAWANNYGSVNNSYGQQFRRFKGTYGYTDQIQYIIDNIKKDPYSRRNIITTWNTDDMINKDTPITNCHGSLIRFSVSCNTTLNMSMLQRSADVMLGAPHNYIQYWAFLMWIAHRTGLKVGTFTWLSGDTHIYKSHYEVAKEICRLTIDENIPKPTLIYNPTSDSFKADDFSLIGEYKPVINTKLEMIV